AKWIMPRLGLTYNAKTDWTLGPQKQFLGFNVDTARYSLFVPQRKVEGIRNAVIAMDEKAGKGVPVSIGEIESLTGRLCSARLALGPAQAMTRSLYTDLTIALHSQFEGGRRRRRQPSEPVTLSAFAKYELEWWRTNLDLVNGSPIRDPVHSVSLWVDAGEHGYGAHTEKSS